jgi:hypothetical protein
MSHPKQKHPQKKATPLTAEEQAKILADRAQAEADAKAEAERILLYGASVEKMSHNQLRGELQRAIKREYAGKPPEPQPGLTIALSTVLLTVLDNTITAEKKLRPDQVNPFGVLSSYPR